MPNTTTTIQVTLPNRRYSTALSSIKEGPEGFTLVLGVARAPTSPLVGHVRSGIRLAYATLNRKEYDLLWGKIWSARGGKIVLTHDAQGKITTLKFAAADPTHL